MDPKLAGFVPIVSFARTNCFGTVRKGENLAQRSNEVVFRRRPSNFFERHDLRDKYGSLSRRRLTARCRRRTIFLAPKNLPRIRGDDGRQPRFRERRRFVSKFRGQPVYIVARVLAPPRRATNPEITVPAFP